MITNPMTVHAVLTEQRVREAARARALDRPDLLYRDPDRAPWAIVRAAMRRVARAATPRERTILTAPDQRLTAA